VQSNGDFNEGKSVTGWKLAATITCIAAALAGCAVRSTIPDGYSGPLATIEDTSRGETAHRAQFFYVELIDGHIVENSLRRSVAANAGRGFAMLTLPYQRDLPARPVTVMLVGEVVYGAPIEAMFNAGRLYSVRRHVRFTPAPNAIYRVAGELSSDRQLVWLESTAGERPPLVDVPIPMR